MTRKNNAQTAATQPFGHAPIALMAMPQGASRVLMLSDCLEFSTGGMNFYGADKRPRLINPTLELRRLPVRTAQVPMKHLGAVRGESRRSKPVTS